MVFDPVELYEQEVSDVLVIRHKSTHAIFAVLQLSRESGVDSEEGQANPGGRGVSRPWRFHVYAEMTEANWWNHKRPEGKD